MLIVRSTLLFVIFLTFHEHYVLLQDLNDKSVTYFNNSSTEYFYPKISETFENTTFENATDIIFKMTAQKCAKRYTITCFKLDMIRLVDRLGRTPSIQILPGVSLVHLNSDNTKSNELPGQLLNGIARGNVSNELDDFLALRIRNYLNSFTLSVKLLDQSTVAKAEKIGSEILDSFSNDVHKGRKKGYGGALWAAGTIATIGMASLAAMAGKAMMTSMLALMLAGAGALRGGGANNGGGGGEKGCAHHYITAHGRNLEMQELKPMEVSGSAYRTVGLVDREP